MALYQILLLIFSLSSVTPFKLPNFSSSSDVGLNTVEIIENHGYPCETHHITTEDGYILTYHRIPHGINNPSPNKKVALLMHGLISSSADYVNVGTNRSLGYLLADLGYDVWLGNSRGNAWSRNHTTLDIVKNASAFFNFSWHEMGYYDLPAAIDYILDLTQQKDLHYVGHSQGCTQFIVMASTRPEYNEKVKLASLMAPAAIVEHPGLLLLKILSEYIYEIDPLLQDLKIYEIPLTDLIRKEGIVICSDPDLLVFCELFLNAVGGGFDTPQIIVELLPVIVTNAPSNAAVKQAIHYGQQIKNGGFSFFDYGSEKNREIYGTDVAPSYDWSKISVPTAVYYGKNDGLVSYDDAIITKNKFPNLVHEYLVPYDLFNHVDFIFAKDVVDLLYKDLIDFMEKN